jgi:hypothetical protein
MTGARVIRAEVACHAGRRRERRRLESARTIPDRLTFAGAEHTP